VEVRIKKELVIVLQFGNYELLNVDLIIIFINPIIT